MSGIPIDPVFSLPFDKAEILQHVMGPSGNLRAPTLRLNDEFIVGFNAGLYESWLSKG